MNAYMAALNSRIDRMGPPPSTFGGNPFGCGNFISSPRLGSFMAASLFTSSFMPFAMGYCNPFAFCNPFMIPAMNFGFGSFTMPNFQMQAYQPTFSMASLPAPKFTFSQTFMPTDTNIFSFPTTQLKSSNQEKLVNVGSSKIKQGLLKGNLVGKEAVITELCKKYNVDLALVVTIIGQESGFGTSNLAKHNNFMGYRAAGDLGKSSKGFGYFSTPEKGLEAAIRNISKYPEKYASVKKADMENIDAIGKIYCEGNTYASAIKNLYNTTVKSYLA